MFLKKINSDETEKIIQLAAEIWPQTYAAILTPEQITYMMQMMYADEVLKLQIQNGIMFYLIYHIDQPIGFIGLEKEHKFSEDLYIHKIYIHPSQQRKGLGIKVMQEIWKIAKDLNCKSVSLNVNRNNTAKNFYEKVGFEILKEENIDIGQGFWMEDYVMQYQLKNL
ncbi:MAG: GNAT family N-acetyltransferase [Flavobacteriaceae bacterium]|nr:GNAT family N-acetyltransferase [Flavobacteriaceae bacterium]